MPTMPVPLGAPVSAAFPSFMSVFGGDEEDSGPDGVSGGEVVKPAGQAPLAAKSSRPQRPSFHDQASSTSIHSDSTDSSPTTTVSTFDSASMTDPSPSSSPESPSSLRPHSPFPPKKMYPPAQPVGHVGQASAEADGSDQRLPAPPQPASRAESPTSRERNVKNLSLNMAPARPATSSGVEGVHALSAPSSPLRPAVKSGRRRPNNLTIQTPSFDKTCFSANEIPPTASHRPLLKHHESSPALPSALSPTGGGFGSMNLPSASMHRLLSRADSESSFSSLSASSPGLADVREECLDVADPTEAAEAQERGYPNGPVRIYDSGVYLYLEPTREEASHFDTVINVAKEVANPFETAWPGPTGSVMSVWRDGDAAEPRTAGSDSSFLSALEWPLTPKGSGFEPEYLHVPWDHHSEILDDLLALCQIIDQRVGAGKRVLIHCQLGVSRSASLVIAYGLYKARHGDFHAMYTAVKERSRWVGPNMSLIYQLMDFRARLVRADAAVPCKPAPESWFVRPGTDHEMTPKPAQAPRFVGGRATRPRGAGSGGSVPRRGPPSPGPEPLHASRFAVTVAPPTSPLPVAPSPRAPSPRRDDGVDGPTLRSPMASSFADSAAPGGPLGRPFRLRTRSFGLASGAPDVGSGPAVTAGCAPGPVVQMDLVLPEVPSTPSVFSPRTSEFASASADANAAGDLALEPMAVRDAVTADDVS